MSEYIPTGSEVQIGYTIAQYQGNPSVVISEGMARFDRWLAQHDAKLRAQIVEDVETLRTTPAALVNGRVPIGTVARIIIHGV